MPWYLNPEGRREALRATLVVLALAAPLIPLQFFGVVLTAGGLVSLGAVALLTPVEDAYDGAGQGAAAPSTSLAHS